MSFYKFLRSGTISPFTGFRWVRSDGSGRVELPPEAELPSLCRRGVHACRIGDLPYWLHDELWRVELEGDVLEGELKVVASRGRLAERIDAWDQVMGRRFGQACVARAAIHAADELADAGLQAQADALREAALVAARAAEAEVPPASASLKNLTTVATGAMEEATRRGERDASRLCGLALDTVEMLQSYPPAMMGYAAARAADARTRAESDDPFADERGWQANWLAEHLALQP
jgi:hypothetical protein